MSRLDPKQVLQELARGIPGEYHSTLFLVGSLAVAYHFRTELAGFTINTKDADLVVTVTPEDTSRCSELAEGLLARGWTRREVDPERSPQPSPTPHEKLPVIRLYPPTSSGFFIEFLGVPARDTVEPKNWLPLRVNGAIAQDSGWYGLPLFRYMGLCAEGLLPTETPIRRARPSTMALSLLLPHTEIGTHRMTSPMGSRKILRSAKDLGRAVAIARLSGREDVESWPGFWKAVLRNRFPKTHRDVAADTGKGLRALLGDAAALEESHYSATYQGFLVQDAVTVDGFRGDAERLLVDAIEPFETST
jgi:hypothetical protein